MGQKQKLILINLGQNKYSKKEGKHTLIQKQLVFKLYFVFFLQR